MSYGILNKLPIFVTSSGQTMRMAKDSSTVHYYGFAKAGTAENTPEWQIQKVTLDSDGDPIKIEYPNGSSSYAYTWANYSSYTYL